MTFDASPRGGFPLLVGMRLEEITPERVVVALDVTPQHHQPTARLHGGVSLAMAETAASIGANRNVADGYVALGQELNANHIRGVSEGTIRAVAVPLHVGRTSQVWSVEIRDEQQRLICVSRCTLAVVQRGRGTH